MKLLSRTQVESKIQKENTELLETNIRLRGYERSIIDRLNNAKENYEPDKLQKLKEFEQFVKDLNAKKTKLLEEYASLELAIEQKKEILYGMVEKQDRIDEQIYKISEREAKLNLRETFVSDLEQKWRMK